MRGNNRFILFYSLFRPADSIPGNGKLRGSDELLREDDGRAVLKSKTGEDYVVMGEDKRVFQLTHNLLYFFRLREKRGVKDYIKVAIKSSFTNKMVISCVAYWNISETELFNEV